MNKNETAVPHIEHGIKNIQALRDEDLDAVTGGGMLSATTTAISAIGKAVATMAQKQ